jgi:hypothetical protein
MYMRSNGRRVVAHFFLAATRILKPTMVQLSNQLATSIVSN